MHRVTKKDSFFFSYNFSIFCRLFLDRLQLSFEVNTFKSRRSERVCKCYIQQFCVVIETYICLVRYNKV